MSFDTYLTCVDHGKVCRFPRSIVEEAFAPFIESKSEGSWKLVDSLADVWIGAGPEVTGFGVSRPPGDKQHPFWRALLEIMQKTQTVFFWIDGGAVVAHLDVIPHMPPDMLESLGTPALATEPGDFWDYIQGTGA
jgi:hypothetical protein